MNKHLFAALATLAATIALPSQAADSYTLDPAHTFPSYEVRHLGFSIQRGRFNKTSGKITLDRAAKTGTVDINIDAASVSTGMPLLEEHLRGENFFDVAKNPVIAFRSKDLKFNGDTLVAVSGDLMIRGVIKPVTLNVTSFRCAPHPMTKKEACGADANVTIKRSDFGMNFGLGAVGDEVKLLINIEAMKD